MSKNFTPLDIKKFKRQAYLEKDFSAANKEQEPIKRIKEQFLLKEKVEYEIKSEEIKPYVKIKPETVKIPPTIKKLGVKNKPTTPKFFTYQKVNLPIPEEKIIIGLKAPITSSFRWLAELALYLLKTAHLRIKVVGGKLVKTLK